MLLYIGYMGMSRWKGYGFQAIRSGIGSSREFQPKNRCCLPTLKVSYFNRTENSEHHTF